MLPANDSSRSVQQDYDKSLWMNQQGCCAVKPSTLQSKLLFLKFCLFFMAEEHFSFTGNHSLMYELSFPFIWNPSVNETDVAQALEYAGITWKYSKHLYFSWNLQWQLSIQISISTIQVLTTADCIHIPHVKICTFLWLLSHSTPCILLQSDFILSTSFKSSWTLTNEPLLLLRNAVIQILNTTI